ncbi:MAG TPA: Crp/Fnr family transcriptional regulator [Chloroflexota bacterium]|jgi:CRP-like cAMP-binding protein|nr:Crp/Fnr family transcriptional regulator [Chloroflexota bacterium]
MAPPSDRAQPGANRLLELLPGPEHTRMFDELEPVSITSKQIMGRPDEPFSYVLFPSSGVVSVLVPMGEEPPVEAGVIGYDGFVGIPLVLGFDRGPHELIVQVPDGGWRMPAARFLDLLSESPVMRTVLQRYALTFFNQTARSSACNRMHDINQRLARWLLMVHDRVLGDELRLTHEFLSEMLGVRRPSVSVAAQTLHHAGLIDYRWGRIQILNRRGLEDAACDDYRQTVEEYEQTFAARR